LEGLASQDDLVRYLRQSGLVPQSVDAILPDLARWERRLRKRGYTAVPDLRLMRNWSLEEVRCGNEIALFLNQAAKNQPTAHVLRNLVGVRQHKP